MDLEKWIKIDGINYEISSHGRVRNLKTNHITKGSAVKKYKAIRVSGHSVFYIHRLVGKYFLDNPDNKPEINHRDCNTQNNHHLNLEWSTRTENVTHAHKTLRFKNKFNVRDEIDIAKLYNVYGFTYSHIASLFNCKWGSIRKVVDRFRDSPNLWATL